MILSMSEHTLLETIKIQYLVKTVKCQVNLLDESGCFLDSCKTFFTPPYKLGDNVFRLNSFFDGIQENLFSLSSGLELVFPRVETTLPDNSTQIYDYIILKNVDNERDMFVWILRDVESLLSDTLVKQRLSAIQNEALAIQNKNIALENEIVKLKNQKLEQERRFKNEFFAKASHDLRAPVNNMIGILHLIDADDKTKIGQYYRVLNHVVSHMKTLVNDLLDLAKLESGKMTFAPHDMDLHEIINSIELSFQALANEKKLELSHIVEPNVPRFVHADSFRLSQVLFNLISNAIKFTSNGKVQIRLSRQSSEFLLFEVSDTGRGIPPEKLGDIFEPFVQDRFDNDRSYGGTGLGLTIVKQIVEMQGGSVSVKSEIGKGSIFSFTLPCKPAQAIATQIPTENHIDLKGKKILAVDDAVLNLLVIKSNLIGLNVEISTATDGNTAFEKLENEQYDLLLLDLELPGLSGGQVLDIYRQNQSLSRPPVVLITGYDKTAVQTLFPEMVYDDILKKPFEKSDLRNLVTKWLS
jgi:signal transduction histidine kinase/CheY-like chemotaxis protein